MSNPKLRKIILEYVERCGLSPIELRKVKRAINLAYVDFLRKQDLIEMTSSGATGGFSPPAFGGGNKIVRKTLSAKDTIFPERKKVNEHVERVVSQKRNEPSREEVMREAQKFYGKFANQIMSTKAPDMNSEMNSMGPSAAFIPPTVRGYNEIMGTAMTNTRAENITEQDIPDHIPLTVLSPNDPRITTVRTEKSTPPPDLLEG
jgi:hypothetical protein